MKWEVIQGDCLEAMRDIPDGSIDACVTDPPYGMSKDFGNGSDKEKDAMRLVRLSMPEIARTLRTGAMAFVCGSSRLIHKTINAGEFAGLTYHRLLWMYKPNDCTYPWRGWLLKSEAIAVFSKGTPDRWEWTENDYCHDTYIFNHSGGELPKGVEHPSVKPLSIIRDIVSKCAAGTVLDPFCGSGTTGAACALEGRDFIGIERERYYCEVARARITRALGEACDIPRRIKIEKDLPLFREAMQGVENDKGDSYQAA